MINLFKAVSDLGKRIKISKTRGILLFLIIFLGLFCGLLQICCLPLGIQEAQAATHTYNFQGINNSNHGTNGNPIAIEHDSDVFPWNGSSDQNDSAFPIDAEYVNISADNTAEWMTDDPGNNDEMAITFRFFIQEAIDSIFNIEITWNGNTDGSEDSNHSTWLRKNGYDEFGGIDTWVQLGSSLSIPPDQDTDLIRNLDSNFTTYIDASTGQFEFVVTVDRSNEDMRTNYVQIAVTYSEPAPVADFSGSPTSGVAPLTVDFTDLSTGTVSTWSWDFNNDGTEESSLQNPSYTYNSPGTYTVSLTVTGPGGTDSETKTDYITVSEPAPVADFSGSPTSGVAPLTVSFIDLSTGTVSTWSWDFDNDETEDSSLQNPSYTYNSPGTYTVTLTVTGPGGTDSETKTDYITVSGPAPVADFSGTPSSGVAPLTVSFIDLSTGTVSTWSWDFNNDETEDSTEQNPTFIYDIPGIYTVTLTVAGLGGSDTETKTDYIIISDPNTLPVADFSATPVSGEVPLAVQFMDLSIGTITDFSWDFGDGQTSTDRNPLHEYQSAGDYTVRLTVSGPVGSDLRGKIDYIHVGVAPPMANFSASPKTGVAPLSVTFSDLSTGTIETWAWDFDNNGTIDSTAQNPFFSFINPGIYTVALSVAGPGGEDLRKKVDYVNVSDGPIADFSASPTSGMAPLSVNFIDQSVGTVSTWAWDFDNDGITDSTAQNPSYAYDTPGTYTVALTVTDSGISDVKYKIDHIHVSAIALISDFSASPASGMAPLSVNFIDQSVGTVSTWAWDFDNDGIIDSTAQNPSFSYDTPGTYTVSLTVTGPEGTDVRQRTDYIQAAQPALVADFSASPTKGIVPLTVQFTNLSIGTIIEYYWEFGDGQTSTEQNPLHEYHSGGNYTVMLTVTGPEGSDVRGKIDHIRVGEAPPIADFNGTPICGISPLSVQFTDRSIGVITDYFWEFGDGQTSTEQNPLHEYQSGGDYTVKLTVTGPGGTEFRGKIDYIHVDEAMPIADFSASPTSGVRPLRVEFTDLSIGTITDYYWDFGDGYTSTLQNPLHDYHLPGDYMVTLTVTGPGGSDIRGKIDYIHVTEAPPIADFMAIPTMVARGSPVQFTDLSVGGITDYYWEFGDGETSIGQHPPHTYLAAGDYTVRLTVTGSGGSDMMEKIDYINVSSGPIAEFSANLTSGTRPLIVQFTDLSMGTVTDYYWEFGDGETSIEQHPSHTYQAEGDYTVRLTVTGPDGSYMKEQINHIHVSDELWWSKTYGAPGSSSNDSAQSIQPTADGGYIVAGWAAYGSDMWISKLNSDGTIRWQKAYNGGKGDFARSILPTVDGGYIVAGDTYSFGDGYHSDIWVLKLNMDGMPAWERTYGDSGSQRAHAIRTTPDGGYIVAGESNPGYLNSVWVLKLNFNGTVLWQKTYSSMTGTDRAYSIQPTLDGGYIVAGESTYEFWVLKLNSNGTVAWQKTYNQNGWNMARSIQQTVDGGYVVIGEGNAEFCLLRLNADGTIAWQKAYRGSGYDKAYAIEQTVDGGYIAAGSTSSFGQGGYDMWVLKLNSDGTMSWQKTYGGIYDDQAHSIHQTADAGYIVAGWTESFGRGYGNFPDVWILRLDPNCEIPLCSAMETSNATISNTTIVAQDTTAFILDTHIIPSIITINPFDTLVETSTVCNYSSLSQVNFIAGLTSGYKPLFVQFTDQSIGTITDWSWEFGDGETSIEQNPSHIYTESGAYTVSLTTTGPDGSDTETKVDYIQVMKVTDFTASPITGTAPLTVYFFDQSAGPITDWLWDFGDGKTSTDQHPSHTYYNIGFYTVSLTVTGPSSSDTETKTDYIHVSDYGYPIINQIKPNTREPGKIIRINGFNFHDVQGDSVVHIGRNSFDASSPRIKLWSNRQIRIRIPNYKCNWFNGNDFRKRNVWVTINGADSNIKKLEVIKPTTCP